MMNTSPQQNTEQIQSTTATFDKQHGMTGETVMPKVAEEDNMNLVDKKLETNQETVTTRRSSCDIFGNKVVMEESALSPTNFSKGIDATSLTAFGLVVTQSQLP